MRRREALIIAGGAALWPLAARAQQSRLPAVVVLSLALSDATPLFDAFRARLKALGQVEGRTFRLEIRLARGSPEAVKAAAADIVASAPDVIVCDGLLIARTLKELTATIPLVAIVPDPVGAGLIASLGRPGGNLTGVSTLGTELHPKRIELLREAVPRLARLAVLWDPGNDIRGLVLSAITEYAKSADVRLDVIEGGRPDVVAAALAPGRLKDADAVLVSSGPAHWYSRGPIIKWITTAAKPSVFAERDYVIDGGLMSYGPNIADVFRRLADHTDRILRGRIPADIPVEQLTKIELVLNLATAKTLGITLPNSLIARADEVIE